MSQALLRDESYTIFTAGHETTASQLAWTFMHLARDRRACARLRAPEE